MNWTYNEIEQDWLGGSRLAMRPQAVVEAFNRADSVLGREWINSFHIGTNGVVYRGSSPTLDVVTVGQQVAALEGVLHAEELIEDLRKNRDYAYAELTAIYLIRAHHPHTNVELYPRVAIGSSERKADFRIRQHNDIWTYVEVTQPDFSEAYNRANSLLQHIASLVTDIKKSFALEVFLRREPTNLETEKLTARVADFCELEGIQKEDLPGDLGSLLLGTCDLNNIVLQNHAGEDKSPRIGTAKVISGHNEPPRHIVVRMAFADDKAEDILRKEARQLPKDTPGLVMAQMSRAPGGIISWEPVVLRRFQPTQHTRVSAVCLFFPATQWTDQGEAWLPMTKLLVNPHRNFSLPTWMADALRNTRAKFLADLAAKESSA